MKLAFFDNFFINIMIVSIPFKKELPTLPSNNSPTQFIGAPVKRREDPALITGQGQYVADISLDGMLHMKVVRSPYAHAKILRIATVGAELMPGVAAIFTGADVNPHLAQPLPMDVGMKSRKYSDVKQPGHYPLATGKVLHVGDPVAVVVAETAYQAADAAEMIWVDYEPLPAVVEPEAALVPDAPVLHEAWSDNVAFRWTDEGGDVDAAFAQADTVVELRLVNQRLIPNAMEPRAVVARYDETSASLTLWTTTQIPHKVKNAVAATLTLAPDQVRVIAPDVGGGFGAKANIYGEEILAPFIARQVRRPIKWVATRSEDYLATCHGRDQTAEVRLAANRDGQVLGAQIRAITDCGAYYSRVTPGIMSLTAEMMTGVYDIPNARFEGLAVFTNKVCTEPYRGAGRPEAAYFIERAMDVLAEKLGLDPAELRRRNFIAPNRFPYRTAIGAEYDSGDYGRALEKALALIDYPALRAEQRRQRQTTGGRLLGIGLACYVEVCGFGPWEMGRVTVDGQGQVTILSGTMPNGQGHHTTWAQIAAEALQIPLTDITVKTGDTAVVPRGNGTYGSRSTPVGGSAVRDNAESVRARALQIAAHLLEAAPEDMELVTGRFQVRGVPDRSLTWRDVAQAAHNDNLPEDMRGELSADQNFKPGGETYPFGVHVCLVEVETETGHIDIKRYLTVDDCGVVINPLLAEGQIHGGIAQGIGQALFEGAVYDELGNLLSGSLMDYAVPKAYNLPSYDANRTETPSPHNLLGVKGIGEAATIGSTPAVVNAVVDALAPYGIRHLDMPLTAEKVWTAVRNSANSS